MVGNFSAGPDGDLEEFIHSIDRCFPVVTSRLGCLSTATKMKLGGLFIFNIHSVFRRTHRTERNPENDQFENSVLDWANALFSSILSILQCSDEEVHALTSAFEMALPPNSFTGPGTCTVDAIITDISSVTDYEGQERGAFLQFVEKNHCLAPVVPVVLLRDSVVLLILQCSSQNRIYNSRTREVLFAIAQSISLAPDAIRYWEKSIGSLLHGCSHVSSSTFSKPDKQGLSQKIKIGVGALGGAVLLGVTGGLAFPVLASVASGIGAALTGVGLGTVGAVFATTSMVLGSVSVASAVAVFGITGGSLVSYKLSNRFGDLNVHDFKFREISNQSTNEVKANEALEIVICISGYLRSSKDYIDPWKSLELSPVTHPFALQWEKKNLASLGNVFVKLLSTELATALTNAYLQISLGAVAGAVTLPISILSVMSDLDNILIVCENRAKLAGQALADIIRNPDSGARPYTLIAFSVGATAVFSCLQALAETRQYFSVQNVILVGATIPCTFLYEGQRTPWQKARSVVSGRFVNVFSKKDMLLHVLCRYLQWTIQVAGVNEVSESGIENFDVSDMIVKHSDYPSKIDAILERVGYIHEK